MQAKQRFIDGPSPKSQSFFRDNAVSIAAFFVALGILYIGFKNHLPSVKLFENKLIISLEKSTLGVPQKPFLPDISGYTVEAVEAKVPPNTPGRILFDNIGNYPEFSEFLEDDAPRRLRLIQMRINPKALIVESGNYDWASFYQVVHALDPEGKLISQDGTKYTLRVPLLVLSGASLVISGKDVSELLLSKQGNAFLVNGGDMFIIRTVVKGWDEEKKDLTHFIDKTHFRPFITTWGGAHLYLAASDFISLGYLKGKSYGLSFSTCTACLKINPDTPRPTGIVVGNRFMYMFYGFYSYEADDVAIIGNKYIDNIIYGVDPHDRSRRLIIAKNEAYGSKKKHGIIVSREVNDSWIFDNYSHHNHGSGIMIDRTSVNNVIANNLMEENDQDGLTLFESQDNISWGNVIRKNKKNGIRVRNSWNVKLYNDVIEDNKGTSIEVYTTALEGQETRDFVLDPYTRKADAIVWGAKIRTSGAAVFKIFEADRLDLSNIDVRTGTHLFPISFSYDPKLLWENLEKPDTVIRVGTGFVSDGKLHGGPGTGVSSEAEEEHK